MPAERTVPHQLDAPVGVPVDAVQGEKITSERLVGEPDDGADLPRAKLPRRGVDERVALLEPDRTGKVRTEEPLPTPDLESRPPAILPDARREEGVQELRLPEVAILERLERRERRPEDEARRLVRRWGGAGGSGEEKTRQEQADGGEDSQASR